MDHNLRPRSPHVDWIKELKESKQKNLIIKNVRNTNDSDEIIQEVAGKRTRAQVTNKPSTDQLAHDTQWYASVDIHSRTGELVTLPTQSPSHWCKPSGWGI